MIDKLQNFIKWANEQMFTTNNPKVKHMDHMNTLPRGTEIVVTIPVKKKRVYVRKNKDVNNT